MKTIEQTMEELQPETSGRWVRCAERQPGGPGTYTVIRRRKAGKYELDGRLWNGGYWVTAGHSPTNAVEAWWEEDLF